MAEANMQPVALVRLSALRAMCLLLAVGLGLSIYRNLVRSAEEPWKRMPSEAYSAPI